MHSRWIAITAVISSISAASDAAPPARGVECAYPGATYTARSAVQSPHVQYRLKIENLPSGTPDSAFAELWRFQMVGRPSGKLMAEIRLHYSCPNGRGACSVWLPSALATEGSLYSEVIRLDRSFTPSKGNATPYAILTPGFAQANWVFTAEQLASPNFALARGELDGPDLSDNIVWVLSACGRRARAGG